MRRKEQKYLVTIGMTEGKHSRGKQRKKMLDGQTKWLEVGNGQTEALKATRDRAAWDVMINFATEHGTCLIDYTT